jgi:hypothetical protein
MRATSIIRIRIMTTRLFPLAAGLLLGVGTAATAAAMEFVSPTRQALLLDGSWQRAPLVKAEAALPLPADGWQPQQVPAWAPIPDSPDVNKARFHACWVKRRFDVPAAW